MLYTASQHTIDNNDQTLRFDFQLDLVGRGGLPNSIREGLLQDGRNHVALVVDLLYWLGFRQGHTFTWRVVVRRMEQAGVDLGEGVLKRGLREAADLIPRKNRITRRRGRPELEYTMPGILALADHFGVAIGRTDRLIAEDYSSPSAFRLGLYREFLIRCPGAYSRQFLAGRLGMSKATSRNYDRRLRAAGWDLRVQPRQRVDYFDPRDLVKELPAHPDRRRFVVMRRTPRLNDWDGRKVVPACRAAVWTAIRSGYGYASVHTILTNSYDLRL